jgi:hypothetical protein
MKDRKNALQAVLDRQAAAPAPVRPEPQPATPAAKFTRPSRVGKRLIGGHFPKHVAQQLKILAAEEDTTEQALLAEALDLLFIKKGKDAVAKVS